MRSSTNSNLQLEGPSNGREEIRSLPLQLLTFGSLFFHHLSSIARSESVDGKRRGEKGRCVCETERPEMQCRFLAGNVIRVAAGRHVWSALGDILRWAPGRWAAG